MKKTLLPITVVAVSLGLAVLSATACHKASSQEAYRPSLDTTTVTEDIPADTSNHASFDFTAYDTPPTPIENPQPPYPVKFRNSGIQGVVVLDVEVTEKGTVGNVIVKKSLLAEPGALDDTAVQAVKSWVFKPAMKGIKPVSAHVNIPIPFSLKPS